MIKHVKNDQKDQKLYGDKLNFKLPHFSNSL